MSFAIRVLLSSLALSMSFNGSLLALPQAPTSTPNPVHSKKSILRMKTAFIDCAEANFLFVVAICIVLS
jgi:hypothetical protein